MTLDTFNSLHIQNESLRLKQQNANYVMPSSVCWAAIAYNCDYDGASLLDNFLLFAAKIAHIPKPFRWFRGIYSSKKKKSICIEAINKKKKMWLHFVWHVQRWFYSFQMLFKWSLRYIFYLLTIDLLMMSIFNIFFRERNGPRKNVQHLTDKLTRCLLIDSNHMHKSYANKNSSLTKYYKRYNKRFNTTFTTK